MLSKIPINARLSLLRVMMKTCFFMGITISASLYRLSSWPFRLLIKLNCGSKPPLSFRAERRSNIITEGVVVPLLFSVSHSHPEEGSSVDVLLLFHQFKRILKVLGSDAVAFDAVLWEFIEICQNDAILFGVFPHDLLEFVAERVVFDVVVAFPCGEKSDIDSFFFCFGRKYSLGRGAVLWYSYLLDLSLALL